MASDSTPHVVQDADMSMWDDPSFNSIYDNFATSAESPFDSSRLFDMNAAGAADSPSFVLKNSYDEDAGRSSQQNQQFHTRSLVSSRSAESSSQDSASETSNRKDHNASATSESPPATMQYSSVKREYDVSKEYDGLPTVSNRGYINHNLDPGSNTAQIHAMKDLSLNTEYTTIPSQAHPMLANAFDFHSTDSSPALATELSDAHYTAQIQAQMNRKPNVSSRSLQDPPISTIEPGQFFYNSSTASPASVKASQRADRSPGALFSNATPSSAGEDMFINNQVWDSHAQNPAWNNDYSNAFASPGGALGLTPSPVMTNATKAPVVSTPVESGRIPLHIAPIPAKSRVETQINIRLTMDWVPTGVKMLHLPTHTIAKAKLLSKETQPSEDILELHTMLVCTSAMVQPHLKQRAMERAAAQNNSEIQARGMVHVVKKEEEEEEQDEEDKPANGGEVKICTNCINRERKRAARKKVKKEEEQAHWEKYETERVIVFNTNEYKPWQEWQQTPPPKETNSAQSNDMFKPAETAMQVIAPMRIACYCRHQNEKDGFQVIFTIKDHQGKVVAQQMSDSILITDDHKTHPLATVGGQGWYDGQFPQQTFSETSHSMIDMHSHAQALQQSKSTSNLPSYNMMASQPFNMHQITSNMSSQPTSATVTPRNLSRPASPSNAGPSGPSKKRKSSSAHRRIPSTLAMTKMETNQTLPQVAMSGNAPFSPTNAGFVADGSYMMPRPASRSQFHTGPSTPIDQNSQFSFAALNRTNSMDSTYAFYSAPSSAHQSRAPSPVLVGPNIAAYQRQQGHGGASALTTRPHNFTVSGSALAAAMGEPERPPPTINKINPAEGPLSGGTEVSIYGSGFSPSNAVMFGDQEAVATTYWGEKALVALVPASAQQCSVPVTIAPAQRQYTPAPNTHAPQFKYVTKAPDLQTMELALRFYSQKETGREDQWQAVAQSAANAWMSQGQGMAQGGPMGAGGHPGYAAPQNTQFSDQSSDLRFAQ